MKVSDIRLSDEGRLLFICRHAKSSWDDAAVRDFDRLLNKRGERDAPEMGRRLAQRGVRADLIISSPAKRALQTACYYADKLAYPLKRLQTEPLLYLAPVRRLIRLVEATDPGVRTLFLVGHNPESTNLANILGGLHIDTIPTAGIVALAFQQPSWHGLAPGSGQLVFFDYPKRPVLPEE
ncbi:MAG: histidine phosphatase family protein [Desulfobulbus sp.]|nr:histidine phosphatase family protein [Desulfobulbus sp.]